MVKGVLKVLTSLVVSLAMGLAGYFLVQHFYVTPRQPQLGDAAACTWVTDKQLTRASGLPAEDFGDAIAYQTDEGLTACQWQASTSVVQVVTGSAAAWSSVVPVRVQQITEAGWTLTPEQSREVATVVRLVKRRGLTDRQACRAYGLLLEVRGKAPGTDTEVSYVPSKDNPIGLTGEVCSRGRYTSLAVQEVSVDRPRFRAVAGVLRTLHRTAS